MKAQQVTMYIKNRRNSNEFQAFGSHQTLYLTESFVLRNRLLFIYKPLGIIQKAHRTNRHIWFLPTRKANAKKPKELALPHRHPNIIITLYTQFYEIFKINLLN